MAAVVEKGIHRFLKHALLIADDDVRSAELEEVLETVVAVDDATIEVVQVRGRKTAAFEWHQRTKVRRDDRKHFQHHPLRA